MVPAVVYGYVTLTLNVQKGRKLEVFEPGNIYFKKNLGNKDEL